MEKNTVVYVGAALALGFFAGKAYEKKHFETAALAGKPDVVTTRWA